MAQSSYPDWQLMEQGLQQSNCELMARRLYPKEEIALYYSRLETLCLLLNAVCRAAQHAYSVGFISIKYITTRWRLNLVASIQQHEIHENVARNRLAEGLHHYQVFHLHART